MDNRLKTIAQNTVKKGKEIVTGRKIRQTGRVPDEEGTSGAEKVVENIKEKTIF